MALPLIYDRNSEVEIATNIEKLVSSGGTHLYSQRLGGRGRWIFESEAWSTGKVPGRDYIEKPCLKKTENN